MSETVFTGIMEIKELSKQHGCKVSSGKPLNWIVSAVTYRTEYSNSVEKIARKSWETAKKSYRFF